MVNAILIALTILNSIAILVMLAVAYIMIRRLREVSERIQRQTDLLVPKIASAADEVAETARKVRDALHVVQASTNATAMVEVGRTLLDVARVGWGAARWVKGTVGQVASFFTGGRSAKSKDAEEPAETIGKSG